MNIAKTAVRVHQNSAEHGFWEENNIPTKLMLIVTEVAEAMEEYRLGTPVQDVTYQNGKPEGFVIELADIIIRALDLSEHYGFDIERALKDKISYNETRPYKHGKIV